MKRPRQEYLNPSEEQKWEKVFTLRELTRRSKDIGEDHLSVLEMNKDTPQSELDYVFSQQVCRGGLDWDHIPEIIRNEYMTMLLLFESGKLVGFIVYEREDYNTIYVHLFCTSVARKGHGNALFREMQNRLDSEITHIKLNAVNDPATIRFYLKLGFRGRIDPSPPWDKSMDAEKYMEIMDDLGLKSGSSSYKMQLKL